MTGDPDQSIYGWRGANLNNILDFEKDFPDGPRRSAGAELPQHEAHSARGRRTDLAQSAAEEKGPVHRKRGGRAGAADDLSHAQGRGRSDRRARLPTRSPPAAAARATSPFSIARTPLSRSFEFALREAGVPYQMVNGVEFFQRKEIKDVLAYLQLVNNPHDEVALLRVINRRPAASARRRSSGWHSMPSSDGISLLDAAREVRQVETSDRAPAKLVAAFVAMFDRLIAAVGPIEELLGLVLNESGYEAMLKASGDEEDEERLANIQELADRRAASSTSAIRAAGSLEAFLEETGPGERHRRLGNADSTA